MFAGRRLDSNDWDELHMRWSGKKCHIAGCDCVSAGIVTVYSQDNKSFEGCFCKHHVSEVRYALLLLVKQWEDIKLDWKVVGF